MYRRFAPVCALFFVACQGGMTANVPQAIGTRGVQGAASRIAAGSVNWPEYRFDNHRDGFNPFETVLGRSNVSRLHVTWEAQLGKLVDYSSPTVVDGVVYIGSSDGVLWAYPATGCGQSLCSTPLWSSTSLGQIMDTPTVSGGLVYVGSQTSIFSNDGKLDVFSASGCGQAVCAPLWQGLAGDDSILQSSPAIAHGLVYIGAHDGTLYAFKATGCGSSTCNPVWTGTTGASIESTPTIANGVVYVGSDDGKLYAYKATGCGSHACKPLWTGTLGSAILESSPAIVNGTVYISSQHGVAAFKAKGCGGSTCMPLWQASDSSDFFNGSPAVAHGRVFIGVEDGVNVYAAKGCASAKCAPLWSDFGPGFQAAVASSPTVANGVVYAGRNTGEVLAWPEAGCLKSTCSSIWSGKINEEIVSSTPTVVNGQLYVGSADNSFPENISGRIYVFALR